MKSRRKSVALAAPLSLHTGIRFSPETLERRMFLSTSSGIVPWMTTPATTSTSSVSSSVSVGATTTPVKFNFQPAAAPTVAGYIPESGQTYGTRNAQTYGWTVDHGNAVFDRQKNSNQLLDTVVSVKAASRWELAVPNGQYTVKVGVGDPSAASKNNVWIEGVALFNYQSQAANTFSAKSITVNVADGRLTMGIGSAATGTTKINFVEVTGATTSPPPTSPPPTSPPPTSPPTAGAVNINFQPAGAPAAAGYLVDGGQTYAARNGRTYGWTANHTDAVFDRNKISDQSRDTVVSVKAGSRWEMAVPNGKYTVKVSVGDPSAASKNNVWIEGVALFNYQSQAANTFSAKSITVSVSDGKLTMGVGSAATGTTRINFIEVAGLAASPPANLPPLPVPPPPPASTMGLATPTASATAAGTTSLVVNWNPPSEADQGKIAKYTVRYAVGDYQPGPAGEPQIIEVPADQTTVTLTGLLPFQFYSIEVRAVDTEGGSSGPGRTNIYTEAPANLQRYLYSFHLPKNKLGFTNEKRQIEVYDISNGHQWVKNIPLPSGIFNVRGVAASVVTNRLYFTYFNTAADSYQPGGLVAMDLTTNEVIYKRDYPASVIGSPDRFDVTPDGKTLYIPAGEHGPDRYWAVVDAATGNVRGRVYNTTAPHNTIVSVDGRFAFLEGQEKSISTQPPEVLHTVGVVDTTTDQIVQRVGPFAHTVRPFTVNGKASLLFATMNNLIGFQIGDVATGKVLYTAKPPASYPQLEPGEDISASHGIALTPDEKEVWVVDAKRPGFHVFDVSGVENNIAPQWKRFVAVRRRGRDLAGNLVPEAGNDVSGAPAWITSSWDGKYFYAEGGEVIDVASHQVIGQLRPHDVSTSSQTSLSPYWSHSRFLLEVQFEGGTPVRVSKQFGLGRVR